MFDFGSQSLPLMLPAVKLSCCGRYEAELCHTAERPLPDPKHLFTALNTLVCFQPEADVKSCHKLLECLQTMMIRRGDQPFRYRL